MYHLLKNALNFDNFKNIRLDLISKVKTPDHFDAHEENEVLNFLKDREVTSEGLKLSTNRNCENIFTVEKKLKHINSLKRVLNEITKLRHDEKSALNKSRGEIKITHERDMDDSSFLENMNNDNYDNGKMEIFNNFVMQEGKNKKGLSINMFCKTLSKRIDKRRLKNSKFFKSLIIKYVSEMNKNDSKCTQINKFNIINKLNVCLGYDKKCTNAKDDDDNIKKLTIHLKRISNYKCILKKNLNLIKRKKKIKRFVKDFYNRKNDDSNQLKSNIKGTHFIEDELYLKNKNVIKKEYSYFKHNNKNVFEILPIIVNQFQKEEYSNRNIISITEKKNCLQHSIDKKEINKNTHNGLNKIENLFEETPADEKVNNISEEGNRNNFLKFHICAYTKKGDITNDKINELKKGKGYLVINNFGNINKSASSLKNVNLSMIRRMSTNNQCKNKKEIKINKDRHFHFFSNNINYYETVINKEKHKEENSKKDNCFSSNNVTHNKDMNEIKQKIKTALISLNNIKKNNYKLKFCLEKEIIDNTIHHNELKKSIYSLFNGNNLQRKNVQVNQGSQNENVESNKRNKQSGDTNNGKMVKKQDKEGDVQKDNINKIANEIFPKKKVALDKTKFKLNRNVQHFYNDINLKKKEKTPLSSSETEVKFEHSTITDNTTKRKTKLVSSIQTKRNIFKEPKDHQPVELPYANVKKEQHMNQTSVKLKKYISILNSIKLNENKCHYKSLEDKEKIDIINSTEKAYNYNFHIVQNKNNTLKNSEKDKLYCTDDISNNTFLNNFKINFNKGTENNSNNFVKSKLKAFYKKKEYYNSEDKYVNNVKQMKEHFEENNGYDEKTKTSAKKYWSCEKKENIFVNNINFNNDCYINKTHNANTFYNNKFVDDKKIHNDGSSNIFMKKSVGLQQFVLINREKKKEDSHLKSVRNIKKIINSEIYVNKRFEKINKRNKIAINIIENYLDNKNRTSLVFQKERERNTYLQANCRLENSGQKKQVHFLPGLYDHYAFLLLSLKNCNVR
ncbi:hypothetical protein MKS88_002453 [Plasmodium brasilianum]|uniref:Uncharacterized protein n=2 Tax=Plasmodium (Plasmodium) TaxID=418103 RepID=A0A1D3PBK7_PLAMA|nr:conserved Plasmodium protein, unknown function [Plasmodium malariae]KAI4838942.1 hypothetical protein MKS88_002453 [Plasmodium brasilianum]SCN12288.1 conserved Plasmodium protein, unknown function [Plasmodium malariae]